MASVSKPNTVELSINGAFRWDWADSHDLRVARCGGHHRLCHLGLLPSSLPNWPFL